MGAWGGGRVEEHLQAVDSDPQAGWVDGRMEERTGGLSVDHTY